MGVVARPVVEFDADFHVYRVGDVVWPSVTQILSLISDLDDIPAYILKEAAERGTRIHKVCDQINKNLVTDLDYGDDDLEPGEELYVEQYGQFLSDSGLQIIASEVIVAHPTLRYCGGVDIIGRLNGKVAVIDIKTGAVPRTVGAQTVAYAAAWDGEPIQRRYALALQPSTYRLIPCTNTGDMALFTSALNCFRFKTGV